MVGDWVRVHGAVDSWNDGFGHTFTSDHVLFAQVTSLCAPFTFNYTCVGSAGALLTNYCGLRYESGNRHLPGMSGALVVHDISGDVVGEHTGGTYESLNPPYHSPFAQS
jgi:hypothetical protein